MQSRIFLGTLGVARLSIFMPVFKKKNRDFFKKWSTEMAYVLGFFCADGCMFVNPRGAHYIAFYSNDRHLLKFIRYALRSEHKIGRRPTGKSRRQSTAYVLQLGSKEVYHDLLRLGLLPGKEHRLKLPPVPAKYFSAFARGYFDGDGSVAYGLYKRRGRQKTTRVLLVRFTSASKKFLADLSQKIKKELGVPGFLHFTANAWRLGYSTLPSMRLLAFLYQDGIKSLPVLGRKYHKFLQAAKTYA